MNHLFLILFSSLLSLTVFPASSAARSIGLVLPPGLGQPAEYGLSQLEGSLRDRGLSVTRTAGIPSSSIDTMIVVGLSKQSCPAKAWLKTLNVALPVESEALVIRRTEIEGRPAVVLCGADSRGLMYAALELADQIRAGDANQDLFASVCDVAEQPFLRERAVSIYTMQRAWFEQRLHDAQHWERYFELLARSRINSLVVIFGYENGGFMAPPYPFFFDVPGFPRVEMVGLTREQQQRNRDSFQTLIDIAHARGVDVVPAIWDHIYRGGVQGGGIAGASELAGRRVPGLVVGVTADNLVAYNQAAIRLFLDVFPDIDGLQFRMHGESGLKRNEMQGFWRQIFQTVREKRPELRIDLRAKELPDEVIRDGLDQNLNLRVATKYWMEQMGLPFHPTHVNPPNQHDRRHGYADLLYYPQDYRVHWRLWNGGTTRLLLWGDPDYVRRFVASARLYDGNSFEVNEMLATWMLGEPHEEMPWDILNAEYQYYHYPFERYWHFYQLWGRLGYDPQTPASVWEREFTRRFGPDTGRQVMVGLHRASQVLPRIVAASYRYRLFPTTRGWAELMRIDDLPDYAGAEGSDVQQFQNPREAAMDLLVGRETAKREPAETSRWFSDTSEDILQAVALAERAKGGDPNKELVSTLADLEILAGLARYHAHRLPAGVAYNLYQETGDRFSLDEAIANEQQAVEAWEQMVAAAGDIYSTNLAFGVHRVGFPRHWREELDKLRGGLGRLRAEQATPLTVNRSFAHVPVRRLMPGQSLQLRVTGGDLDGPDRLTAWIAEDDGPYRSATFRSVGVNRYAAALQPGRDVRQLRYYIEGMDAAGRHSVRPAKSEASPFVVWVTADERPPVVRLEKVPHSRSGADLPVTAAATDDSGVKWMRLRYRHLTQFEDYQTAEMLFDPTTGLWRAVIPGEFIVPEWDLMYFVEALDNVGNGCMVPDLEEGMPYVVVGSEQ